MQFDVTEPWPVLALFAEGIWRVLLLQDYNTRVVFAGAVFLGIGAGLLGVYLLLRRRVLIGDAISHATLPGVALAFLWTASTGQDKSLAVILIGAAISGSLGGMSVLALRHLVQIREDAALGIVLSVFFGAGVSLLSIAQQSGGNAAGLESFIYGKAASMTSEDVWLSAGVSCLVILTIWLCGKELKILCFDTELARSQGWPVLFLDSLLIGLVVAVTIVGLQAVGLIMIIALLVIPAASARFWTHDLNHMLLISAVVGAASCAAGTLLSAMLAKLPSGAAIVLCGSFAFAVSFAFGRQRGVVWHAYRMWRMRVEQGYQHFLRAAFEVLESRQALPSPDTELRSSDLISLKAVSQLRRWTPAHTFQLACQLSQKGLVVVHDQERIQLTPRGFLNAQSTVRDHRLLENYMIEEAAAPLADADRAADYLEHDLQPEHQNKLKRRNLRELGENVPPSPHKLDIDGSADTNAEDGPKADGTNSPQ